MLKGSVRGALCEVGEPGMPSPCPMEGASQVTTHYSTQTLMSAPHPHPSPVLNTQFIANAGALVGIFYKAMYP